jgi:hypothetical protein
MFLQRKAGSGRWKRTKKNPGVNRGEVYFCLRVSSQTKVGCPDKGTHVKPFDFNASKIFSRGIG